MENDKIGCSIYTPSEKDIEDSKKLCSNLFDDIERIRNIKRDDPIDKHRDFLVFFTKTWTDTISEVVGLIKVTKYDEGKNK